ncbi:DUF2130 domain-containing protein [Sorangium sp. So ce388]|uniref:DUF2130 domain-containing protein n=1 Tax=Sorangium sp. So ce388 TaxID=3133309 RepID=UPI003F5BED09
MSTTDSGICPYCGQTLLNHAAAERVRKSEANRQREFDKRVAAEAHALAENLVTAERTQMKKDASQAQDKRVKSLEKLLNQVQDEKTQLERRVQRLSANERGEFHEVDIYNQISHVFPGDKVERRGKGADILHTVYYETGRTSQRAGVVVYECKDTLHWDNEFIKQIRKAGAAERTTYLILVTRACPKGEKTVCVRDGVIVIQPAHVLAIAQIIRRMVIEAYRAGLTTEERNEKAERLLEYLTSDDFRQAFGAIIDASESLMSFLSEERRAHERAWARREHAYDDLARKSSSVDEANRAIIEERSRRSAKVIRIAERSKAI